MKTITPILGDDPLGVLGRCGGYYDQTGTDGPLVGYAGSYTDALGKKKHHVGRVFANFAKAEEHGPVLNWVADGIINKLIVHNYKEAFAYATGFCSLPIGGNALGTALAIMTEKQYIFPEKRVIRVKSEDSREESELAFDRHEPQEGQSWFLVEDVCNEFSTTSASIKLVESYGASVAGILCFLNRSLTVDTRFMADNNRGYPVIALVRKPIPKWEQDHPEVADDIARGNVVWKPKTDWDKIVPFIR